MCKICNKPEGYHLDLGDMILNKPKESVYIENKFSSHMSALVHQHVIRFIISEVKMLNSCSLKPRRFEAMLVNRVKVKHLILPTRRPTRRLMCRSTHYRYVGRHTTDALPTSQSTCWLRFFAFTVNRITDHVISHITETSNVCVDLHSPEL